MGLIVVGLCRWSRWQALFDPKASSRGRADEWAPVRIRLDEPGATPKLLATTAGSVRAVLGRQLLLG